MGNNDLINQIKAGDDTVLKQIYLEHKIPFIKWIYQKFQLPREDAIEIFQYAVVAMYDNIVEGKLEQLTGSIKTYLFSIGRNKAFELTRNNQKFMPRWKQTWKLLNRDDKAIPILQDLIDEKTDYSNLAAELLQKIND